ncbi:thioesterase family protein [Aquamicrobium sp.]|uniref:acyl-CoA thioesterase n=1 Tax=Aquamicrobium sp. TaxID=1872579 RepID=UPI002582D0AD|nr:thioesterase family protein [Aquamicrobium sp.]MCK9552378.1 acyl-CoA thioesterase [Aquamicrobium sp.]
MEKRSATFHAPPEAHDPAGSWPKPAGIGFCHRLRVRFSEVDAQKVVFFGNYFTYFDVALTEFSRAHGIRSLLPQDHEFHVVHASTDYVRPIRYDEEIDVAIQPERVGTSSITFRAVISGSSRQDVRARGLIVWVLTDQSSGRGAPLPQPIRQALLASHPTPEQSSEGAGRAVRT